jgi:RHS repeat-associated protein
VYDTSGQVPQPHPTENVYRYTGQQLDQSTGFYYLRARYYNPAVGRFLTMDTYAGDPFAPASLHKYTYCNADPINQVDPSGNETLGNVLTTAFLMGGIAGAIIGGIRGGSEGAVRGLVIGSIASVLAVFGTAALGLGIACLPAVSTVGGMAAAFGVVTAGSLAWSVYDFITARNARERWAAGVSILLVFGFATYGAYKFSQIPSLAPHARGDLGVLLSEAAAALRGERVVAREVTIDVPSVNERVRVDIVVKTITGALKFIDAKFGPTARLTASQKIGYEALARDGGVIAGANGEGAGLPAGTVIGPTQVQIDTWQGAKM